MAEIDHFLKNPISTQQNTLFNLLKTAKKTEYGEKFGFKEDYNVHYKWKAFTTDPFPSMVLNL